MTSWSKSSINENEVITEYSLVKHLKNLCSQDEKYKNLYAVWTMDQEIYSKALMAVPLNFPHYSMHEASHSLSIINKIEMLLGEDRIRSLSPTDTFMILESSYLHDFGMIISNNELNKVWGEVSFQRFLKSLIETSYDEDIIKAAKFLLDFQNEDKEEDKNKKFIFKENSKWAVDVKNYVTLISAEYFRRKHSTRSADWINDPNNLGININYNKLIPERIMRLIGKVAICHGTSFEKTFESMKHIDNGIGTDKIHPRFIACLLRLGDLLDLDNGRFNAVFENTAPFPDSSKLHKLKHGSITHFLICQQKIEVSALCEDDKVYRVTREWFDWLKEELKNLSSKWAEIVPNNFQGGPPSLGDIKLSIK